MSYMKQKIIILTLPYLIIHHLTGDGLTEPGQTLKVKHWYIMTSFFPQKDLVLTYKSELLCLKS